MKQSSTLGLFTPAPPQPDKPLMLLLPGMDGTGKLFGPQIVSLVRHFDLRCLSIPENNRQDWNSLTHSTLELVSELKQSRTMYLCGESYGGCLALKVASAMPQIADRLILINPASSLQQQTWLRWSTQVVGYAPTWLYEASSTFIVPLLANFEHIHSYWQRTFIETVRPISQSCVAWRLSMLQNFELPTHHLEELSIPTALLASGADRLLPSLKEVYRLNQILPNAVTHILPHSGHVCLLEQTVDLVDCLKMLDFLPKPSSIEV